MRSGRLAALVLAFAPGLAAAVDVGNGKLTINGNGSWAFQRTDSHEYLSGTPDGNYRTSMFDLVLTARPAEDLVLAAQLGFDPEEVELEWAFAEWRFSDAARFRIGKVKQPFGNYAELQFAGTARPFYTLATSVYGPANVTGSSYSGVGLTGEVLSSRGFGVQYDAYGGSLQMAEQEPYAVLRPGFVPAVDEAAESGVSSTNGLVGGRVSLLTPWDLTFRLSSFTGRMTRDEGDEIAFLVYGGSALYRGERLWVSVEAFQSIERNWEKELTGYAEVAWFLTPRWQVAGRIESNRTSVEGVSSGNVLLRHDEVALGLNYWFDPRLVLKASAHRIRGLRFAERELDDTGRSDETLLFVAGAQFTF